MTAQIGNTQSELKKLAEQNPELKDAYVAKQRRLKVSKVSKEPNEQQSICVCVRFTVPAMSHAALQSQTAATNATCRKEKNGLFGSIFF